MKKKMLGIFVCTLLIATTTIPATALKNFDNINTQCITSNITIASTNSDSIILYPVADTFVGEHHPDENHGTEGHILISDKYGATSDYDARGLVLFNLSEIPSGSIILSATFSLYYYKYDDTDPVGREITCHRINEEWKELKVTYNNMPDSESVEFSSQFLPPSYGWVDWDVKTEIEGLINGTITNYGWMIRDYKDPWGTYDIPQQYYYSKESSQNKPPTLVIDYIANDPPVKPSLYGWIKIKTGETRPFDAFTSDPNGDNVQFKFHWGDSEGDWSDLGYWSYHESHGWDIDGEYPVKVKARDEHMAESDWSEVINVTINEDIEDFEFAGGLGFTIIVNNYRSHDLVNITYTLSCGMLYSGDIGIIISGGELSGEMDSLPSGQTALFKSKDLLGLGILTAKLILNFQMPSYPGHFTYIIAFRPILVLGPFVIPLKGSENNLE